MPWKTVPTEPTPEIMSTAAMSVWSPATADMALAYRAIVQAAPEKERT